MFLLLLIVLGTANIKAQVRIGGDGAPHAAAVLDLNANNDATPTGNTGALALPRVSLASTTAQLNGITPITGMMVYNTNVALGVGLYFWDGSLWRLLSDRPSSPYSPIAWVLVLDTSVNVPAMSGGQYAVFVSPGTSPTDLCTHNLSDVSTVFTTNSGFFAFYRTSPGTASAYLCRVTCYRPLMQ